MPIECLQDNGRMSQAVIHGETVYVAGQIALECPHAGIAEQTRAVLARIDAILAQTGSSKRALLSATIWLTDLADFEAMNAVWDGWLAGCAAPARATVGAGLALPGLAVEIAVVAAVERLADA